MKNNLLIIFSKYPKRGNTKTRLSKKVGEDLSSEISKACINDLIKNLDNPCKIFDINIVTGNREDKILFEKEYNLKVHVAPNFSKIKQLEISKKFNSIFSKFLKEYKKVILIPMDLPFITYNEINRAFSKFNSKKFVIGPENNGGVYLIGLSGKYLKNYFREVPWSTEESFFSLLENFGCEKTAILKKEDDINHLEDLYKNASKISKNCHSLKKIMEKVKEVNRVKYQVHVCCVIKYEEKFLLIKRSEDKIKYPGYWGLVGGHLEIENKKDGLITELKREIEEETGLKPKNFTLLENHIIKNNLSICFFARLTKKEKILKNHEVEEYAFFKICDLKKLKLTPHTKKRIILSTKLKNL